MTAVEADQLELNLLREFEDEPTRRRRQRAQLASLVVHALTVLALVAQAKMFPPPKTARRLTPQQHITLLFAPPRELTQKEPNRAPPSKLFLGLPELARAPLQIRPEALPSAPPPPLAKGELTAEEKPPQFPRPEILDPSQLAQVVAPPAPPAPPKLALEDAHARPGGRPGQPQAGGLTPQRPSGVIEGAVKELSRGAGRSGTIVGDGYGG
ncbi:MAG: hypothetical protein AAB223_09530, partial [Pseudomonadota bacterium]